MSASSTPSSWQQLWEEAQPRLHSIQRTVVSQDTPSARIIRVGQLDAELLDQELVQVLQEPVTKALGLVHSAFRARFQPEITLLLQLTLYKFSVWDSCASYGARLQGLRYSVHHSRSHSRLPLRTLLIHGALTTLVPYLHTRIRAHALSNAWPDAPSSDRRRKAWESLTRVESAHGLFALLNFIAFLWDGRYRTLPDRLLGMRLISSRRLTKRDVSYEFMNRQMVWHAFTEFLLFLLPLINVRALRRRLIRAYSHLTSSSILPSPMRSVLGLAPHDTLPSGKRIQRGKYWSLPLDQCAICYEDAATNLNISDASNAFNSLTLPSYSASALTAEPPSETENASEEPPTHPINIPYATSCGHIYCYTCLATRMVRTADERTGVDPGGTHWECLRCGEGVADADRVELDVEFDSSDSEFGLSSVSMSGMEYSDEYGSEGSSNMGFTDMSGSLVDGSEEGLSD
ncbi:hypothetical protein K474DRAFT_1635257 [Panus rudis PR-1116 ss-1]|nr:hypothetical protein K474DRAFT_1635257 [Panus rudis PR-1116 ss-1]